MLPPTLLNLFAPVSLDDLTSTVSLIFFALSLVLGWRLTNGALGGKGAAIGSALFAAMFAASLVVVLLLQWLLGVPTL